MNATECLEILESAVAKIGEDTQIESLTNDLLDVKGFVSSSTPETGEITTKKALNYTTSEPVHLAIMFVEGGGNGNDFYRLNAIMHKDRSILEEVQPVNPFASLFDGDADHFK